MGAGLPRTAAPDANAFLETLRSRAGRAAFQQVLGALPETFVSGDGGPNAVSVRSMDDGILRLAADAFARGLGWWVIGRRFSREEALDMPSILELELDGIAEGAVQAYRALALRPPASVLKPRLKGARPAGRGRGDARRASGGKPKKEKARTAAAPGGPPPKKKARKPRAEPRPLDRPAVAGDRVKLIRGPFKGRLGTVLDLREGEAQVRVGLLPVWFACADMIVLPPREPRK